MNENGTQITVGIDHTDPREESTTRVRPVIGNGTRLSAKSWSEHARSHQALAHAYEDVATWDPPLELYAGISTESDDPDSALPWRDRTRSLAIWPTDGHGFEHWAIRGEPRPIKDDTRRTIVFLFVRNYDGFCPEFRLEDSIFWIENDQFIAHGNIEEVYQHDIIVTNEGLLVPVVATLYPAYLRPFTIEDWVIEEHIGEYENMFSDHHFPKPLHRARKTLVNDKAICMPPIAVEMDSDLADNIHAQLEHHLRTKK